LQCVAVFCSVSQCVPGCCSVAAVCCDVVDHLRLPLMPLCVMTPALQCVAVCCSVLQCVAVCCSVLQCVAVCCSVLQRVAVCCSVLQCGCSSAPLSMSRCVMTHVLQCAAVCCSVAAVCCTARQCVAVCCSVLQCAAVCCSVLQCGCSFSPPLVVAVRIHLALQ